MGAGSPGRGDQALAAEPHPGRTPFLTADQEKQVLGWLAEPPTKHGFGTDLWTAKRVAQLILQKLKVRFHPHYLREWLTTRNYPPRSRLDGRSSKTRSRSRGGSRGIGRGSKKRPAAEGPPRPDRRDRAIPQPLGPLGATHHLQAPRQVPSPLLPVVEVVMSDS